MRARTSGKRASYMPLAAAAVLILGIILLLVFDKLPFAAKPEASVSPAAQELPTIEESLKIELNAEFLPQQALAIPKVTNPNELPPRQILGDWKIDGKSFIMITESADYSNIDAYTIYFIMEADSAVHDEAGIRQKMQEVFKKSVPLKCQEAEGSVLTCSASWKDKQGNEFGLKAVAGENPSDSAIYSLIPEPSPSSKIATYSLCSVPAGSRLSGKEFCK